MKLYLSPGACSIGIHVLLEEIGKPYETVNINLRAGEQVQPAYSAINPKHKVPALQRDDGSVLTEFPAIAYWLAATYPQAALLPTDPGHTARAIEYTDYIVSTMHMQGFQRIFRPTNFTPSAADEEKVRDRGKDIFAKGFSVINHSLDGHDYLVGKFSFADAALFYVSFWAVANLKMQLPERCAAHYARMLARPSVTRVMQAEGFVA
jgi:glutathione S-transferase